MEDAGLLIRVQRELREDFLAACRAQNKPAAQVLGEFMHGYLTEYEKVSERRGKSAHFPGALS